MEDKRKIHDLWSMVLIELTSSCNFSCEFCPSDSLKRKRTMMPATLWQKVISELGEKKMCKTIFFHLLGEPLLHKDVFEAISFANKQGLSVSLYTNAALLDEETGIKLLDILKKGRVVLSLQDISPVSFTKRCRNKLSWNQYVNQMQCFLIKAEKMATNVQVHCMVDIQSCGWNLYKIYKVQKDMQHVYNSWCKAVGMHNIATINILNPAGSYPLGKHTTFFVKHRSQWANQHIPEQAEIIPSRKGHCALMNDTFAVLSDGTCTYCCSDYEGNLNLGNAYHDSLENIFYDKKSTAIRLAEKRGDIAHKSCTVCRGQMIDKKTKKPMLNRNLLSEYYFFKEHLGRYGLKNTLNKVAENLQRRL